MRIKLLGAMIGASLLFGFAPAAEATAMAAPPRAAQMSAFSGNVTGAVLGSEHRQERRELRRFHRHESQAMRRMHREERWGLHRAHREERRSMRRI